MTIKERRRIKKFYKNNTSYPAAVHDNNKDFMHNTKYHTNKCVFIFLKISFLLI